MAGSQGHTEQWLGNVPTDTEVLPPQAFVDEVEDLEAKITERDQTIRDLNQALANGLETSELLEQELERQIAARDHTIQAMERDAALFKGIIISTVMELSQLLPPEKRKPIPSMSASMKTVACILQEVREALLGEYML